jgi:hypothetical protein
MRIAIQDKLQESSLVDNALLLPIVEELKYLEENGVCIGDEIYYVRVHLF